MPGDVKTRSYRSAVRADRATATRRLILAAAREHFVRDGYAATTVSAIAATARVSVDTLYASVGRRPQLMLAVIDMTLGDSPDALAAEQRGYVQQIRAAPTAREKIAVYVAALGDLLSKVAPLQDALHRAGESDEACASAERSLVERRASNMRLFAADLRATGELRDDLTDDDVADLVWATNSVEFLTLLRQRQWSPARFSGMLEDLWIRLLLRHP
jgi:AcrR family transcriptional regulator